MSESNKKTPRTFQCRDNLWVKFEELAQELECSVDYLINDAMKLYARQRGQTASASQTGMAVPPPAPPSTRPGPVPSQAPPPPKAAAASPVPPLPGPPKAPPMPVPSAAIPPLPAAPPLPATSRAPLPPPPSAVPSFSGAPTLPGNPPPGPPPLAGPPPARPPSAALPPPAPAPTQARPLFLHYDGEAFHVNKERFFIGRGKQASDLTIRDPNVSRQHAVVEFIGGVFYMVDMGSTNGIEFGGQRVHRKAIQHGDVFKICDHQILCSFQ